ncbi:MAG TPA: hypothetical protein VKR32_04115 [Puia sp.]|nr:hypothetical protein [Puia sp.]
MNYRSTTGFLAILFFLAFASCTKNQKNSTPKATISLSSSEVKRNEPVVATTNATSSNLVVRWTVNSAPSQTWLASSGNKSVFIFSNGGNFTITASYFTDSTTTTAFGSSSSQVSVSDSIYNDSSGQWASCTALLQEPITNSDQIFLTPVSYSDTGLTFVAHTQETYGDQYPHLDYMAMSDTTSGYGFVFATVTESPCGNSTGTPTPATSIPSISQLSQGTNNFTIDFHGTIYTGTITVTNSECTFQWNYTSGVIMSPLTIQKQ